MSDPLISLLVAAAVAALGLALFWPQQGLVARWQRARSLTARVLAEDALKHVHQYEIQGRRPTLESIAGALNITTNRVAEVLAGLQSNDLLRMSGETPLLTAPGREVALHVIRAHRLWERYLADETGFEQGEWHYLAEHVEHTLSPGQADALSAQLGYPSHDPHGDPIPTPRGEVVAHGGQPLATASVDDALRIVHIEDEPGAIYAQLVAEGLYPGMEVRVLESSPKRIRFWAAGDEHVLAPVVAANVSVASVGQERPAPAAPAPAVGERLADLKLGGRARVISISPACRGQERRRLMDLGILPDSVVTAELRSPGGDPTAYRIRGALIALRREQAALINIQT